MTSSREVDWKGRGCQRNIQILGAQEEFNFEETYYSPGIVKNLQ